jgi:septum formation protein
MLKTPLFLASGSLSRQTLLQQARIPFVLIKQDANEYDCDWTLPLEELVVTIALYKMEKAHLPTAHGERIVVLTADTLPQDSQGIIHAKPKNREEAVAQIKALSGTCTVSTGFCLEEKRYLNGQWQTQKQICKAVTAECFFKIPDRLINTYLATTELLKNSTGITIENYGMQFLKEIHGSFSTILGLPMYELREALESL